MEASSTADVKTIVSLAVSESQGAIRQVVREEMRDVLRDFEKRWHAMLRRSEETPSPSRTTIKAEIDEGCCRDPGHSVAKPAEDGSEDEAGDLAGDIATFCRCAGQCGSKVCKSRRNACGRGCDTICDRTPRLGFERCDRCRCELADCPSIRIASKKEMSLRWCVRHEREMRAGPDEYATPTGVKSYGATWGLALRVVARMSFLLRLVMPDDVNAFVEMCSGIATRGGPMLQPFEIAWLFFAQTIKWPTSVRFWWRKLEATRPESAELIMDAYRQVILFSHDQRWPEMFARMNSGLMNAQTGLAVNAKSLGFLTSMGSRKRPRDSAWDAAADPDADASVVKLGPAGTQYIFRQEPSAPRDIALYVLKEARKFEWRWPSTAREVMKFANDLTKFAAAVRRHTVEDSGVTFGLHGGRSLEHMYHVKSFVRLMLLYVARFISPHLFDDFTVEEIAQWTPDELDHVRPVLHMNGRDVQETFGVHILMLSCWACLADSIAGNVKSTHPARHEEELRAVLEAPDRDLWLAVQEHEKALELGSRDESNPPFPPGPRVIWEERRRRDGLVGDAHR